MSKEKHHNDGQSDGAIGVPRDPPTSTMHRNFPASEGIAEKQRENDEAYEKGYQNGQKGR